MKTTKKVLSVFLAVVMIMLSMSVCFGTISFAATNETNAFVQAVQCDAMKNLSIKKGTKTQTGSAATKNWLGNYNSSNTYVVTQPFTITAANYTYYTAYIDIIKKLDNAIQSLSEYTNKHTHVTNTTCGNSASKCTNFGTLKTALIADIGQSTYNTLDSTYNIGDLVDAVLDMSNAPNPLSNPHSSGTTGYTSTVPQEIYNVLTVSLTYDAFMKSFTDPADIPGDSVNLSYEYKTAMGRQNYTVTTGSSIFKTTNYYYHSCVNTQQIGYFSKSTEGNTTATNKAVLVAMKTALSNNSAYLDETTIKGVHTNSTDPTTLNAVATEIETAYNALGSMSTYFDHFFKNAAYSNISYTSVPNLVALIKKAAVIAGYKSACETIAKDYALYANETYKTYSSTEVNALYNELKTAYEGYKAADDSLEAEIATYYGIDGYIADIPAVLDALLAYYYEIFLGSIDERAFGKDGEVGYVNKYQTWTVEDIDNDVITSADILTALNEVTLDIDTITSDAKEEDIQNYFGMSKAELLEMLGTVKTHLESLGYYAGLNDDLYAQYATFTNNIANVINADSSKLYSVLSGYEQWHKDLQTFFTTWATEVGEYKDLLEDDLQATMNDYMVEAYTALKTRVVTQINNAYDLYEVYYDMYGNNVTMASLTYFATLRDAIDAIEHNAYNWMKVDHETYGTKIDAESIKKYDALQVIYGAYGTFVANRGFDNYTQTVVDTVREDTIDDIARENADIDGDDVGEYEVADEDIEAIIDLLEAALQDEEIKALLGSLINKDENGNPTGEAFDLSTLLNDLINDNLYTDNLINTIISFLYPVVAQAFLDVWVGIEPVIDTTAETDLGTLPVHAILNLYDVDTAIEAAGVALAPVNLGNFMSKNTTYANKYPEVIETLKSVTAKTRYNADGSYADPWKSPELYEDAVDEEGNVIYDESTGEAKQVMALDWGIDEATDKKAAFVDAACAALCGLEPLLYALLLNQHFVSPNIADSSGNLRGGKIGTSVPGTTVKAFGLTLTLTLDPITLMLDMSANDGWDNVLAPIFEALGLENIPHSEDMKTTRDFLEDGLLAMIDQLVAKVAENPIETILDVIPNLVYALEADLVAPLLDFLETNIYYEADTYYSANAYVTNVTGNLNGVMKAGEPAYINVGQMLNLESMGVKLSDGLAGILEMLGIDIPVPDVSVLATAGELVWKDTNRSRKTYTYGGDKAAYIQANRADVLEYLIKYVLDNLDALLTAFNVDTSTMNEIVKTILDNVNNNPDGAVAAIVELLNQQYYDTLAEYEWFSEIDYNGTDVDFTPASAIYMSSDNDWTKEKATYLYNNIETLLDAVLTMANSDLDIEATLAELVGGLFTNSNITAIAKLLGTLDLDALVTDEDGNSTIALSALVKKLTEIDLSSLADYAYLADLSEEELKAVNWGFEDGDADGFVTALVNLIAPLQPVLDYILTGEDISITFSKGTEDEKSVTLVGYNGYNNAIVPLLEALGCDTKALADTDNALEVVLRALVARINTLTTNDPDVAKDGAIYGIIDMLPGILYFISSDGLTTTVRNLLQPVYVILDTIRPVYDLDLNELVENIEVNGAPLGISLDDLGAAAVINVVENLTGLDLDELIVLIYDVCEVIGVEYESVSTFQDEWKRGEYVETFDQVDMITVILSFLLEWVTVEENAAALDEMLGTDGIVQSLSTVFASVEISYNTPNWMYWFESEDEFNAYVAGSTEIPSTLAALEYANNWSEETAQYIADNISEIADTVIGLIEIDGVKYASIAELVDAKLVVFTTENLQAIVDALANLLKDIDANLLEAAGYLLGVDINGLVKYEAPAGIDTASEFADELANVLTTYAKGLVEWLFLGEDYAFFLKSDSTDSIVINGGEGYAEGLALILEAVGCKNLPAAYDDETTAATEEIVAAVFTSFASRIEEILADPVNEVLDLLPNLIYFLNANGAGVAVDNLLQPVYALLEKLEGLGVELSLEDLLKITKTNEDGSTEEISIDLSMLSLESIVNLVEELTDIDLTALKEILVDFCIGTIKQFDSVSVNPGYEMTGFERKDVITVLLTTALLVITDEDNAEIIENLVGEDVYEVILNVLNMENVEMQEMDWILTEYADTETAVSGIVTSELYEDWGYGPLYTEEMAQHIADNFGKFVDNIIYLLGIEINGTQVESLDEIILELLDGSVYTTDLLNTILGFLQSLPELVEDFAGAELSAHVNEILKSAIGVDLTYWDSYTVAEVSDRASFTAELCRMLEPFYPVLEWLLADSDFAFFADENGDIITLLGAEGYAYGIVPILEAFQCEGIVSTDDYYNAVAADKSALITTIINPLLDKVDSLIASESIADEILEMLPSVIYFINSNGLDTSVKNVLNAVYTLLNAVEPITGEVNLYDLIGFNLENLTFEEIFDMVIEMIGEATGYTLSTFDVDYIAELTTGYVVSYTSANGSTAYTMTYAEGESASSADMVTIILRLALSFLACEENQAKVLAILAEKFSMDAASQEYLAGVFSTIADLEIGTYLGMDKALATVYYIFYGTDIGVDFVATGKKDLNAEWQKVLEKLGKTELGTEPTVGNLLAKFLDVTMKDVLEDVFDSEGVASNGFIKFFQKIMNWIQMIINWIKSLFA